METEVKLAFENEQKMFSIVDSDWFSDYCMDGNDKHEVSLYNSYYDTEDGKLRSRHCAIRVRIKEDEDGNVACEHTVKLGGKVENGLHQRYEWNVTSDSKEFTFDNFFEKLTEENADNIDPEDMIREAFEGVDDSKLKQICTTVFNRVTYTFGYGDSIMEACFDYGNLNAGGKSEKMCELELELISGDVVDLKEMADFIVEKTGALYFNESKFSRCMKLLSEDK